VTISKRISAPVNFIVHSLSDVNGQLQRGRPFFIDIVRDGVALYAADDQEFAKPSDLAPAEAKIEAQKHFDYWFPLSTHALSLARTSQENGVLRDAAFMAHQAAERAYHCILLTLSLYSPKSHRLNFLRGQAEPLLLDLIQVWPRDTKFAQRCFELLRQAYVNARYSPHYKITPQELEWIGERIELLQTLVKGACERHIAALEKAVGSS
jgi:HEPN domain-containing protein